jgi:uncharacterized cysteine cluster protein YcgN (CxxCxxCC family)
VSQCCFIIFLFLSPDYSSFFIVFVVCKTAFDEETVKGKDINIRDKFVRRCLEKMRSTIIKNVRNYIEGTIMRVT